MPKFLSQVVIGWHWANESPTKKVSSAIVNAAFNILLSLALSFFMLTQRQENLLFEIYSVSFLPTTVVTEGNGNSASPTFFDVRIGVKQQLVMAIALINEEEAMSLRVTEILEEYENFALDYSTIDREGYAFRPARNLKRIHLALYPYTGIVVRQGMLNNQLKLG